MFKFGRKKKEDTFLIEFKVIYGRQLPNRVLESAKGKAQYLQGYDSLGNPVFTSSKSDAYKVPRSEVIVVKNCINNLLSRTGISNYVRDSNFIREGFYPVNWLLDIVES